MSPLTTRAVSVLSNASTGSTLSSAYARRGHQWLPTGERWYRGARDGPLGTGRRGSGPEQILQATPLTTLQRMSYLTTYNLHRMRGGG
jgi:hypothetical protein